MKKYVALLLTLLLTLTTVCGLAESDPSVYISGDYQYTLLEDGTAEIIAYTGNAKTLFIPPELDGYAVTSIGPMAFFSHYQLELVVLPEALTIIKRAAFAVCMSMNEIIIPETLTTIEEMAFSECYVLPTIALPENLTTIGEDAFMWCDRLKTITVTPGSYAEEWALANGYEVAYPTPDE